MALVDDVEKIVRNYKEVTNSIERVLIAGTKAINEDFLKQSEFIESINQRFAFLEEITHKKKPKGDANTLVRQFNELKTDLQTLNKFMLQPQVLFSMSFIYLVAVFDAYITDILSVVLKQKPEMLKNGEKKLSYDKLIELHLSGDLISNLVEMEMNELGYKSIEDQAKYIKSRFGIDLAESGVSIDDLVEIRAKRNLLVHNNGVVNSIFLQTIKNSPYKQGDKIEIKSKDWRLSNEKLFNVQEFLSSRILEKFQK